VLPAILRPEGLLLEAPTDPDAIEVWTGEVPPILRPLIAANGGLNDAQEEALLRSVGAGTASDPVFSLVQGPPGTGKTHTVLSILNAVHVTRYQAHLDSILEYHKGKGQGRVSPPPHSVDEALSGTSGGGGAGKKSTVEGVLASVSQLRSSQSGGFRILSNPDPNPKC